MRVIEIQLRTVVLIGVVVFSLICMIHYSKPLKTSSPPVARYAVPYLRSEDNSTKLRNQETPAQVRAKILILQFIHSETPLHRAPLVTHRIYASHHGYTYRVGDEVYFPTNPKIKSDYMKSKESTLNKLYVIRDVIGSELDKAEEECVDWIFWTDMDTLILDRTIPIDALLQSSSTILPEPYLMCSQDHNGLNNSIMLIRPHLKTLLLMSRILTNFEIPHRGIWNDQCQLNRALRMDNRFNDIEIAKHFYQIPKVWFNAYHVDEGDEGNARLQVHLMGGLKRKAGWSEILFAGFTGFEKDPKVWSDSRRKAESMGQAFWAEAKGGIDNMRLLWDC